MLFVIQPQVGVSSTLFSPPSLASPHSQNRLSSITIRLSTYQSSLSINQSTMAAAEPQSTQPPPTAEVHIVYTDPPQAQEPEAHHLRTLTSVLGSEEAAKGALLYTYKHAASGFSAKLTPEQVEQISKQPGVLQVVKSRTAELHSGPAQTHTM